METGIHYTVEAVLWTPRDRAFLSTMSVVSYISSAGFLHFSAETKIYGPIKRGLLYGCPI